MVVSTKEEEKEKKKDNGAIWLFVVFAIVFGWYSSYMTDEVDRRNEYLAQAYEEVYYRNSVLTQAYTDIATLQSQMKAQERRMDVALSALDEVRFQFYYVRPEQKYGVNDLQEYLQNRIWKESYTAGEFDCSKMSSALEWGLENEGYHTFIVIGDSPDGTGRHAWLLVETVKGKYTPVEATQMSVIDKSSPYYDNYFKYEQYFETIQEAVAYNPKEYSWWD